MFLKKFRINYKICSTFILSRLFVYLVAGISLLFALFHNGFTQCYTVNLHSVSLSGMIQMFQTYLFLDKKQKIMYPFHDLHKRSRLQVYLLLQILPMLLKRQNFHFPPRLTWTWSVALLIGKDAVIKMLVFPWSLLLALGKEEYAKGRSRNCVYYKHR